MLYSATAGEWLVGNGWRLGPFGLPGGGRAYWLATGENYPLATIH